MSAFCLPRWRLVVYAAPAVALAMPTLPVYVFLPSFYAQTVGLGLAAIGAALLFARILDVLTDPLVGYFSDRLKTRWGRRKPWMLGGGVLAAIALIALVSPPEDAGILYLAGWSALLALGWTMVAVPYAAWGAEMSSDPKERTRITSWREGFMVVGILAAGAMPALAPVLGFADAEPMEAIAWAAVGLGAIGLLLLAIALPEDNKPLGGTQVRRLSLAEIKSLWTNRPFRRLLAAWFVNGLANGLPAVTFLLYLEHGLQVSEDLRNGLIFAYFLAAICALPLWTWLAAKIGKHRAWSWAMIAAVASFAFVPLLGPGDWGAFLVICLVTGAALGADVALPPAMQADVVDYDSLRTGQSRAGAFFALWSMASKLALAAAVGIGLPVLEVLGFTPGVEDGPDPLWPLLVIYAVLPVVLKCAAVILVWGHPLTPQRQKAIALRLDRRRLAGADG